jgi:D-lyxose ketol-isomerase
MKRSEINRCIRVAAAFFAAHHFILPPYADWTREEWRQRGTEADEIRSNRLGWDVTDFHSGNFSSVGLTLFTLRNGPMAASYAEKIMFVGPNQVTPFHYHVCKTEDIINRGGGGTGALAIQLYNSDKKGGFARSPVSVAVDGVRRELEPGGTVILGPGESITLTPYLYHQFYAVDGDALVGEVSSVNDDDLDNHFHKPLPRYPEILEDELPWRLLCTEYPKL